MSKIDLVPITGAQQLSAINDNFRKVEEALNDKVLYRDNPSGEPNQVKSDVDMNGKRIYNLPQPQSPSEPVRYQDLGDVTALTEEARGYAAAAEASASNASESATTAVASAIAASNSETNAQQAAIDATLQATAAADSAAESANRVSKTSDTGSAVMPAGTDAQRDADGTPSSGWTHFSEERKNLEVFDGLEWQEMVTRAELSRVRGLPIFYSGIHNGTRESLVRVFGGGATPNDAIQINALTHPELVKGVLRGDVASCDETAYQNDPYQRGQWSRGTAYLDEAGNPQGWVRTPDLNQAMADSLPPPFARGGSDAKAGHIGKDTMRRLQGGKVVQGGLSGGVFVDAGSAGAYSPGPQPFLLAEFDSAAGVPEGHTGTEFAPWNVTGVSYSITSHGVVNGAAIDAEQVMGEVFVNRGRIATLESFVWANKKDVRVWGATYTNGSKIRRVWAGEHCEVGVGNRIILSPEIGGVQLGGTLGTTSVAGTGTFGNTASVYFEVPPFEEYSVFAYNAGAVSVGSFFWQEAD